MRRPHSGSGAVFATVHLSVLQGKWCLWFAVTFAIQSNMAGFVCTRKASIESSIKLCTQSGRLRKALS
jgi:hypothetical protein